MIGKVGANGELYQATIKPNANFDADSDAAVLRKAMKGLGTDEGPIIEILGSRTLEERRKIASTYKSTFGRDLQDDLKSELSGNFEKVALALFSTPSELLAQCCYDAMKGAGTDEKTLINILGVSTNQEIRDICTAYDGILEKKGKKNRSLEKDIEGDCGGTFKKVLIALVQGDRDEPTEEDMANFNKIGIKALVKTELAEQQAQELYDSGEGKIGTDESTFIKILCKNSVWQVAAIDKYYQGISSHSLLDAISSELSGDLKDIMKVMVKACLDRPSTYAELLKKSMKGAGTDDNSLIRLIVSRCEVDLGSIKETYQDLYNKTLQEDVKDDTSGHYRAILLKLIGS